MSNDIRNRMIRNATPEEAERHLVIQKEVERELAPLKAWAREAASQSVDHVAVGTVFNAKERHVVQAIDEYAVTHSLGNRGAVVREALSRLLGLEIASQ